MKLVVLVLCTVLGTCFGITELERKLQDFVYGHGHIMGMFRQQERFLIAQLVATSERYELKEFIDLVGFQSVLKLLTDLPQHLSHDFTGYLFQALHAEDMIPGSRPPLHRPKLLTNIIGLPAH